MLKFILFFLDGLLLDIPNETIFFNCCREALSLLNFLWDITYLFWSMFSIFYEYPRQRM